jgi:hypothetical protein
MIYTETMEFSKFIEQRYLEWRANKRGNVGSSARYAREELGIEPYLLNDWMTRGKLPTAQEHIDKLIAKFGVVEIYDMVGWPESIAGLPFDPRVKLALALFEIRAEMTARSIKDRESPEAAAIAASVFEKHALKSTKIL